MTHVDAFRLSVNPISRLSSMARLRHLPSCRARAAAGRADAVAGGHGAGRRFLDAVGRAADLHPRIHPGPVARIVAVIIIISTGLALAFGDTSGGFRKLIQIVFGLSIAFAASSFFLSFFSFSGGAVV